MGPLALLSCSLILDSMTMELRVEQRTDLALRTIRLLADRGTTTRAREMAPELDTTVQYLPHVMRPLVREGWVVSEPGPTGGYRLVIDLSTRTILDLIELFEGPIDNKKCILNGGPCGGDEYCALHFAWIEAREALTQRLSDTPLTEGFTKGTPNE